MLARPNRVITGEEFRTAVRRGSRVVRGPIVYHVIALNANSPARFGFVVPRAVGDAVRRNRLRRRLRAVSRELVDAGARGADVVVRALPGAADLPWNRLRDDARSVLFSRLSCGG